MRISVVIPCYNHGVYLREAIESVRQFKVPTEVIVVNDGSTEPETLSVLEELKKEGVFVVDQENGGPAKARNAGIAKAKGTYILPLDSDNTINVKIFEEAFLILEANPDISVVYTDAEYMGDKEGIWKVGELNARKMMLLNQIDTCALIRKEDLLDIGGYDESKAIMSNEDWELWIKMLKNKKRFYYLPRIGFYYRVSAHSLSATISQPNYRFLLSYLIKKHPLFYADCYETLLNDLDVNHLLIKKTKRYIVRNKLKTAVKVLLGKPIFNE